MQCENGFAGWDDRCESHFSTSSEAVCLKGFSQMNYLCTTFELLNDKVSPKFSNDTSYMNLTVIFLMFHQSATTYQPHWENTVWKTWHREQNTISAWPQWPEREQDPQPQSLLTRCRRNMWMVSDLQNQLPFWGSFGVFPHTDANSFSLPSFFSTQISVVEFGPADWVLLHLDNVHRHLEEVGDLHTLKTPHFKCVIWTIT